MIIDGINILVLDINTCQSSEKDCNEDKLSKAEAPIIMTIREAIVENKIIILSLWMEFLNWNCNFHPHKAETSPTKEVINFCITQVEHIPPTSCYICQKILVFAVLVACLIHLKNVVDPLIKSKIC